MKKSGFINRLLTVIFMLITCQALIATNIQVSDIVIVERNDADRYIIVQFNLSWDYSFRVDDGANTNWDAAWVFMKYKDVNGPDNVQWGHATMAGAGHTIPGNYTSSLGATDGVNKGIFIYPNVIFANNAEINGVQLRWDYGEDGLLPEHEVDIRVFGIEMVYVPTGNFYVGSGGEEASRFYAGGDAGQSQPFQITSASFQIDDSPGNLWATGNRTTGTFTSGYPTGYNAFYMMKHNITQQAYVDFLNALTYEQQDARINGSPGDAAGTYTQDQTGDNNRRHAIRIATQGNSGANPAEYETDHPYLPVNWISPEDLLSYLDWAALRSYTELEYEKAARGPASPVPGEYAWGNTRLGQVTEITNAGTATEAPVPSLFQRDIIIDHTKVADDLTDFPVLVRLNEDNFNFNECQETGYDIRFYDRDGTELSYKRERHDFNAEKAEYWVKIPNISSSQNTVITMEYGDLTADDGADPGNVWDDDFVSVWHLDENADGTSDEYEDSKGENDGTGTGSFANRIEGQIGFAQDFGGEGAISVADDSTLDIENSFTISGWIKPGELTGVIRTEPSGADWSDFHSEVNTTVAADKLAIATGPGVGWRISNPISLDDIKRVGSSSIDWDAEYGYRVVAFTSGGVFSVPEGVTEVDVLVVGGGGAGGTGSGGHAGGGGGGAGGLIYEENLEVSPGTNMSVTVGAGGASITCAANCADVGTQGGNSQFGSLIALGGGGGASFDTDDNPINHPQMGGGSGGGASGGGTGGSGGNRSDAWGLGTAGQGNNGGQVTGTGERSGGAGGGGAGAVGSNTMPAGGASAENGVGTDGGDGLYFGDIFGDDYGDNGNFAGGGGGGNNEHGGQDQPGQGGNGGGGSGGKADEAGQDASPNTGGGGGGSGTSDRVSGAGGSGIVLVRYKDPQSVKIYTAINESADTPPDFDNVQVFTENGAFTMPEGVTKVDVLIVAGGGGGGGSAGAAASGAGGGAGGLIYTQNIPVSEVSYDIVVGAGGGSGGSSSDVPGSDGGNSSAFGLTAIGGGGGGSRHSGDGTGRDGGSGGGVGAHITGLQGTGLQPGSASGGFGSDGGDSGFGGDTSDNNASGGGGGAGGTGGTGLDNARSGNGGIGRYFGDIFGDNYGDDGWFAGGGGGGNPGGSYIAGIGGKGGGANGGSNDASNAMANTGGGGGGAGSDGDPSDGGSGIVIVRWGYASQGDPIPGINEGDDLTGKYLWVKQELSTNNATYSPELERLELEIKGEAVIAGKGEDAYQLSYYDGQLRGYVNNQMVSSSLTPDEYQHVAISYNGTQQRIYVNGLLTGTSSLTGNINTNANNLVMGLNLEGELDEIRLSDVTRSQAWLLAERHSGLGDLVQIGDGAQVDNAVYGNRNWGGDIGRGPLRVGFGASPTSSRTASGSSYWGIMELSGNLWELTVNAGRTDGREFTGLHGNGLLNVDGLFDVLHWDSAELGLRGSGFSTGGTDRLRISDRNNINTRNATNRENNRGGRGVRTAP